MINGIESAGPVIDHFQLPVFIQQYSGDET